MKAGPFWYLVLMAGVAGDAITFKTIVAILMPDQGVQEAWALTVAFTVTAVGLMHAAGMSAHRAGRLGRGAVALGVIWVLLGVGAFWVRWTQALPGGDLFSEEPTSSNLPMALLFLALYTASGALAAWVAFHKGPGLAEAWRRHREQTQPLRDARLENKIQTRVERYAAQRRRPAERARLKHDAELAKVDTIERQLAQLGEERVLMSQLSGRQATELKHEARLAQALLLRDPAATSALTSSGLPAPRTENGER